MMTVLSAAAGAPPWPSATGCRWLIDGFDVTLDGGLALLNRKGLPGYQRLGDFLVGPRQYATNGRA
jgi:hypothetical protein